MIRASALAPQPTQRIPFQRRHLARVPANSGCYVLSTFDETVVYIGKAQDLRRRVGTHLGDRSKREVSDRGVAVWLDFRLTAVAELGQLESAWVEQYKLEEGGRLPPFNEINPPAL
ncbi:MAG: hypothetical protein F4W96_03950 [Chloroflexi bacterium]|nr:hypothetical protein [Chloroflexota bacterium]